MATSLIKKPKLFVFDCDSTIIEDEVIELIAKAAGSYELVAEITENAMQGNLDFQDSLAARVKTFEGLSNEAVTEVFNQITYTKGVKTLFNKIHYEGGFIGIVSGGFHEVVDEIAKELSADVWLANRLETVQGKLTGRTTGEVITGEVKARMLNEWAQKFGVELSDTIAIGDGANDIPMMREAGISIAYNAKPIVREAAQHSIEDDLSHVIELVY